MKALVIFWAALGFVHATAAQSADDYRDGWRTANRFRAAVEAVGLGIVLICPGVPTMSN
jgi:hypothetical protein